MRQACQFTDSQTGFNKHRGRGAEKPQKLQKGNAGVRLGRRVLFSWNSSVFFTHRFSHLHLLVNCLNTYGQGIARAVPTLHQLKDNLDMSQTLLHSQCSVLSFVPLLLFTVHS